MANARNVRTRVPGRAVASIIAVVLLLMASWAASADTLHVPEDYPTIQQAIDAAVDGDEILVGPGTYAEPLQISTRVTITGREGAAATVLDAEGSGVAVVINADDVILQGLTIRSGTTTQSFGASAVLATTRCALFGCRFLNNTSSSAPVVRFEQPQSQLSQCHFEMNSGTTIVDIDDAYGMIIDECEFIGNTATYTVLWVPTYGTDVVFVTEGTFKLNQAQSLISSGDAELRALDCSFIGNVVSGYCVTGGGDSFFSDARVERSLFADNEGGLVALGGQDNFASVRQCVFLRNQCGNLVAIPFPFQAFGAVMDCVFVQNTSTGLALITANVDDIADFFVDNSIFYANDARPIFFRDSVAGILGTVFYRNRVLDGPASIWAVSDGIQQDVAVDGCVFWGNYSPGDIEIRLSGNNEIDDISLSNNYIEGGRDAVEITGGRDLFWGATNERLIPSSTTAFGINLGTHLFGGLPELLESDDTHLRIRSQFGFSASEPNIVDLRASTTAPPTEEDLVHVLFAAETRLNQANGTEKFRIRNWTTGGFDLHHIRVPATEDFIFISQPLDAGPYVRDSDRRVELSIRQSAIATFGVQGFISSTDLIAFAVTVPEP